MRMRRSVLLCAFVLFATGEFSAAHAQSAVGPASACTDTVVRTVGEHFRLPDFSLPRDTLFPSPENGGLLIAATCRPWPGDRSRTIAAFAYDGGSELQKDLLIAIVDPRRGRVIASRKGELPIDGATQITSASLTIDTAPYQLSKTVRAFGIRTSTFRERCGYEGGLDDELTLYVVEGSTLEPVLAETMSHWTYGPANRCSGEEAPRTDLSVTLAVEGTSTNGLADLRLMARASDGRKPVSAVVKYDGTKYDLRPWKRVFERWAY